MRKESDTSVDQLFIKCNKNTIWCKIGPPAVSRLMWKGLSGLLRNISVHFKSWRSLVSQLNVWTLVQGFVGKMSFKGLWSTTLLQSWRIKRPLKSSKWFQRSKLSKERKLDVRLNLFFARKLKLPQKPVSFFSSLLAQIHFFCFSEAFYSHLLAWQRMQSRRRRQQLRRLRQLTLTSLLLPKNSNETRILIWLQLFQFRDEEL